MRRLTCRVEILLLALVGCGLPALDRYAGQAEQGVHRVPLQVMHGASGEIAAVAAKVGEDAAWVTRKVRTVAGASGGRSFLVVPYRQRRGLFGSRYGYWQPRSAQVRLTAADGRGRQSHIDLPLGPVSRPLTLHGDLPLRTAKTQPIDLVRLHDGPIR